jgi:hypothetical protein
MVLFWVQPANQRGLIMNRVIILFLALSVSAQDFAPDWVEESWRSLHYPKSEWYTGFATDKVSGQPGKKEFQTIEANAQNKLSESIIVNVQGTSTVQTANRQMQNGNNFSESTTINYDNTVRTTSNAILTKVDVKSYFDRKNNYIYAFAAVKKKDIADFYRSNINSLFSFASKEFSIIEQLTEQGKKNQAFNKIQIIEDSLKNISYWGSYLRTVEFDTSHSTKERDFWQKINNVKITLERSTTIFLDILGIEHNKLIAQMQDNCNCIIAESRDKADYVIIIRANLNRCTENNLNEAFCYANADASVNNSKFQRPIVLKIPEAKGGWGNGNKEKATEEAFKKLTNSLAEKIVQSINK